MVTVAQLASLPVFRERREIDVLIVSGFFSALFNPIP